MLPRRPAVLPALALLTAALGLGATGCSGTGTGTAGGSGFTNPFADIDGRWTFKLKKHSDAPQLRAAFRDGFDFNRINENLPTAWRDQPVYEEAAASPPDAFALASAGRGSTPAYDALIIPDASGSAGRVTPPPPAVPMEGDLDVQPLYDLPDSTDANLIIADASPRLERSLEPVLLAPSPASAPSRARPEPAATSTHVIQDRDSFWKLAERYYGDGTRFQEIADANPGLDPMKLPVGRTITIPAP